MKALPIVHPALVSFASAAHPLRPSRVAKFLACPMSVVLQMHEEHEGGKSAQTGNLVHDAAEAFHKTKGGLDARIAAGQAALEAARVQFPEGDEEKARAIFRSYAADKKNQEAIVLWCEEQVTLTLAAAEGDPTGEPIVVTGTLDQVRLHEDGSKRVWDIKTGDYMTGPDNVLEYLTQQATYTLAARQTLDATIEPGGLIYTPAYDKARANPFLPNPLTVEQCEDLLLMLPPLVACVRRGEPIFRPSAGSCKWCHERPWPNCRKKFFALFGR